MLFLDGLAEVAGRGSHKTHEGCGKSACRGLAQIAPFGSYQEGEVEPPVRLKARCSIAHDPAWINAG